MYRGWPPPRGEFPPQHPGRGPPSPAPHPGHGQLDPRPPFLEERGLPLPPVHYDYYHEDGGLPLPPVHYDYYHEDGGLPLPPVHYDYYHHGPPDPSRPPPPHWRDPSPGPDPSRPPPPHWRDPSPGPDPSRPPPPHWRDPSLGPDPSRPPLPHWSSPSPGPDGYWASGPLRDGRMKSPSPPCGGVPMDHSLVTTEQTPPETAPPLNPTPYNRDNAPRHVYEGPDGRGPGREGSRSPGNPNPNPGRSTAHPPSPSRIPEPGRAGSREGQMGVRQKPGQIEVFIDPQQTKLPHERQDCTLPLLKEEHVLLNLLTDIVTQNNRAAGIKVLDEVKEEEKKASASKEKWKPVNKEVPFQVTDVLEDLSEEKHEGTVLKALLKTPQKPQAVGQPPEVGLLLMTVAGEQKQLTFTAADIQTTATMLDGDKIQFNISTNRETKEERAVNLDILPDTFVKSTVQRQTGTVVKIEEESGFIKCQKNPQLFFNMSEVMEVQKLELNQKVDFSVIPHETAEGGNQAVRIRRLTEAVFTPVAKLLEANKEKKKMTIKLMRDHTASLTEQGKPGENKPKPGENKLKPGENKLKPGENKPKPLAKSDELKATVQPPRSQDNRPSDGRKDSASSRRRPRRSRSSSSSSSSPVTDRFGRHVRRKRRSSSRERDGRGRAKRSRSKERDGRGRAKRSRSKERDGRGRAKRSKERDVRSRSKERDGRGRAKRSKERDVRSRSKERDVRSRSKERDGRSRSKERDGRGRAKRSRSKERDVRSRSKERDGRGRAKRSKERDVRSRSKERDGRGRAKRSRSKERDGRSRSKERDGRSRSKERDGRGRAKRSRSTERDGRSRSTERDGRGGAKRSRSKERSGSDGHGRSRSRSRGRLRESREQEETSQRMSGVVDEELARKKRELEELNKMIACHKTVVAVEPRGGRMDVRPAEKTCIDYDHGRIAVPLTGYEPSLLKRNDDSSGLLFPTKTEPSDRDQYHSNPVTRDHIHTSDSPEHSHPSHNHTSSKMSYNDEPLCEQTSAQISSYQSQSPRASPPSQAPPTQHPCQTPPSQPPPKQTPPSQFPPRQMHHKQPPAPQTPPGQPPTSKPPQENRNLSTQIARFLNTLNRGVDAGLLSTAVKEAQDQIAVIAENTQELPQCYCDLQAGDDQSRDHHRWRETQPEHTHRGSGPDRHHDLTTTELNQDDLLPHKKSFWDGRVLSQIEGMAQEQHSRGAYQRERSMEEDEQFHYGGEAPAARDYKRSSGSADRHERDGDGPSPTRETRKGSRSKSEHFDKIRSLLQTIGLNLNTAEVSKLADRTQERLYGRREELSERLERDRGYSSSRREDRSRTGSSDSEHLQSIVSASLLNHEEFPAHQQQTEYEGFLDRDEEEALEKARLMQTLINAEQATAPITPTPSPSTSQCPPELPGTSYSPTQYGWHQGASTHYSLPLGSAASSPGHQTPAMYLPAGYPACATQEGCPSGLNLHYYGPPPTGPPPVSAYALHPLTGAPTSAKPPKQVNTTHKSIHQNLTTLVTLPTSTSDTSKQTATTTTVSRFFKVIETVETETVQKEAPKPEAVQVVQLNRQPPKAHSRVYHGLQTTTESKQASSGPEDDIKAKQKERLEWFNLRMMEKTKQKRMMMMEKRNQMKVSARNKNQNNPPEKVIISEPKNIWICGHSLVYWAEMRAKSPEVGMQLGMDPGSVGVWWKGIQGMTWPQLLPQLLQLKIKWPNPDVVILHLGGNDLAIDNLSDFLSSVKKDLTSMRSIFPQCLLVWSDILPRRVWRHSKDSLEVDVVRATINRRVHSIIAQLGGTALTHNNISCGSDSGLYRPDGVHLSGKGIDTFNLNLQDFLMKWEMEVNMSPQQS